jgi:hypothetical protein
MGMGYLLLKLVNAATLVADGKGAIGHVVTVTLVVHLAPAVRTWLLTDNMVVVTDKMRLIMLANKIQLKGFGHQFWREKPLPLGMGR